MPSNHDPRIDREDIVTRYLSGETATEIAGSLGFHRRTIMRHLKLWRFGGQYDKLNRLSVSEELGELQLAYVAGLFDGEGCICICPRKQNLKNGLPHYELHVVMSLVDQKMIEQFRDWFGGTLYKRTYVNERHKPAWAWNVGGIRAGLFLSILEPYLILKKKQALAGIMFAETITWHYTGNQVSPEAAHLRGLCYRVCKAEKAA